MNISQKYLPVPSKRRPGIKLAKIKYIVAHDTGNLNSTALQNVNYYINSANEMTASAHAFVDDLGVIVCIPFEEVAYHVRRVVSNAIDEALAIELCYFTDKERSKTAYKNYVEYIQGLCAKYDLNPATGLVGHYKLDPTRRTDPINAFSRISKTWDDFVNDVGIIPNENLNMVSVPRTLVEELVKYL